MRALHVHEPHRPVELEVQLERVEQVKQRKVVFLKTQVLQGVPQFVAVAKAVGQDDDERASSGLLGQLVQHRDEARPASGPRLAKRVEDDLQVGGVAARRDLGGGFLRDVQESGGVALVDDEVAERGGETLGVVEPGAVLARESHRAAAVEHDVAAQVGLGLEFLEVIAVGACEDAPVEPPDVVAGDVVAVLGELDAGASVRAAVVP